MTPKQVILPLAPELHAFRAVVFEMDMPTVDLEAALSQIFDAVQAQNSATALHNLAGNMANGEALFENSDIEDDGKYRVFVSVLRLGEQIRQKLQAYGGYNADGTFPYEFKGMLNHDTVVLAALR